MTHSLEFLEVVFSEEFMARVEVRVEHLDVSSELDSLIVFTDASCHDETVNGAVTVACLVSIHVVDQRCGRHHKSHARMPEEYFRHFPELKQYIGRGELAGAIAALFTMPVLFRGRKVIHFVDNAPALSNLINGYSGKPDMARLVNMFHLALLALDVEWYGEWIPSKANVADIMTRVERFGELLEGLEKLEGYCEANPCGPADYELVWPPLGRQWSELIVWMRAMRVRAAGEAA